jgi:hypothetical protein
VESSIFERILGGASVVVASLFIGCHSDSAATDAAIVAPDAPAQDNRDVGGGASAPDAATSADGGLAPRLARKRWVLAPDELAEAMIHLTRGATVTARFSANLETEWDVHVHEGAGFVFFDMGVAEQGEIRFVAPRDGDFCYAWLNVNEDPLDLDVEIHGERGPVVVRLLTP